MNFSFVFNFLLMLNVNFLEEGLFFGVKFNNRKYFNLFLYIKKIKYLSKFF